jgi:hypothetical protein
MHDGGKLDTEAQADSDDVSLTPQAAAAKELAAVQKPPPPRAPAPEHASLSLGQQLCTPVFWHVVVFFAVHFFRYVWLLGTVVDQMEAKGDTTDR